MVVKMLPSKAHELVAQLDGRERPGDFFCIVEFRGGKSLPEAFGATSSEDFKMLKTLGTRRRPMKILWMQTPKPEKGILKKAQLANRQNAEASAEPE